MSKLSRHKAILELLDETPVTNQEELQRLLRKRGFESVNLLAGGVAAWEKESLPLEK